MASHEHLDQLANSSTSSDEDDDDASTSSDDDSVIAGKANASTNEEESDAANVEMEVDSLDSETKPRIKLTLRTSIASLGSAGGAVNGTKREPNDEIDENKKPPPTLHIVKKAPLPVAPSAAPTTKEDSKSVMEADQVSGEVGVNPDVGKEANGGSGQIPVSNGERKDKPHDVVNLKPVKAESDSHGDKAMPSTVKTEATANALASVKAESTTETKVKSEPITATGMNGTSKPPTGSTPSGLPKKKKKKLPKLPLSTKRKLPLKGDSQATPTTVKATVVASDEAVEEDAVATVLEEGPAASKTTATTTKIQPSTAKRKPQQQSRPIRLPPLTSPGLLIPQASAGMYRSALNGSGFATPEAIFEQSMASAGYTTEGRTKNPHRGSSVRRIVGDMFDSNVAFALNFPSLVPKDLWSVNANADSGDGAESNTALPNLLLKSLGKSDVKESQGEDEDLAKNRETSSRKRLRPSQVSDMFPLSLTLPYPQSYLQKRLQYVKEVQERERAIILRQETQEKLEIAQEEKELLGGKEEGAEPPKISNPVKIPPIPTPPPPPPLSEFEGIDAEQYEGTHPIYQPKGKQNFVAHLDKDCFHITEGRYFGLSSNFIADPHFVGANAPGISGLTLSCGSGLATSSTSSGGGGTAASSVLAAPPVNLSSKSAGGPSSEKAPKKDASIAKPAKKTVSLPSVAKSGSKSKFKLKHIGPTPTANASDLRKVMEGSGGSKLADNMRKCIIRAAVHASRSGKHGQSFLAPDGKAYPDVSKAFAAHAGLKPCGRCKNNKQGAYHCRLRRKHKELDHDGGNSPAELAPLLLIPMEDLLIHPKAAK